MKYLPASVRQIKPARWLGILVVSALAFRSQKSATIHAEARSPLEQSAASLSTAAQGQPGDTAQAQLLADSARLLELSRELQVEVSQSSKDTLSVTVVRKAEEVERLAKSLKERIVKKH